MTRALDVRERVVNFSPVPSSRCFMVRKLHCALRSASHLDRFVNGFNQTIAFAANVRRIQRAAGGRRCLCKGNEFVRVGKAARWIDKTRRDANRALFARLAHEKLRPQLGSRSNGSGVTASRALRIVPRPARQQKLIAGAACSST